MLDWRFDSFWLLSSAISGSRLPVRRSGLPVSFGQDVSRTVSDPPFSVSVLSQLVCQLAACCTDDFQAFGTVGVDGQGGNSEVNGKASKIDPKGFSFWPFRVSS